MANKPQECNLCGLAGERMVKATVTHQKLNEENGFITKFGLGVKTVCALCFVTRVLQVVPTKESKAELQKAIPWHQYQITKKKGKKS